MPRSSHASAADREEGRLRALRAYAVLDTEREPEFDDIVAMAARACGTPIAHIAFPDRHRQWFKAEVGIGRRELPAEASLCAVTMAEEEILLVPDIAADPVAAAAVRDLGTPPPRFYAGVPLRTPEDIAIGTLCVLDHRPRTLDDQQLFILKALARSVMAQLDLRKALAERDRALERERRAEAERRRGELRSRQVRDSAVDDGIVSTDLDGRVTGWSEGARRIMGWTEEEMTGRPLALIYTPEDGALAAGGGTDERWHMRRDGTRFWAEGETTALRDEGGTVTGFLKTLRDRTERRRAERTLRESRERFDAASASGLVGFVDWDAASGLARGDGRFAGFLGVPEDVVAAGIAPDDLLGRIHPRDRDAVRRQVGAGVAGGSDFVTEFRLARGGEEARWLLLSGRSYRAEGGRPLRLAAIAIDVTASRAAEAALRRLNETLEATVAERTHELDSIWRHARDMLCVARPDGTFCRLNPAWAETLGRAPEDLLDVPFLDLVHPDDRGRTTDALAMLGDGLTVPGFENRCRHRDGSYRRFSWNAVTHEGLIYAIVRDVTAEREAASTLAGAEEALRQSQKMEAVGQLTGGIAHDFNNLLTGITGALDLMQRRIAQGRSGDVGRYVDIAIGSADRAAALTHRLLAFSRRQPLDPRPTDVNRLVGAMEDLLRRTTGEAIAFEVALAADLWPTLCDPHQLENALLNLVINARDAMPEGGRLRVATANVSFDRATPDGPVPGAYVALTVADTGFGMAPEVAARVFDPFFTTKPPGQGTGLGLSMIYGFVRQSEGHVAIDSAPGRGTSVRIVLPRFAGAAAAGAAAPTPAVRLRAPAAETVLVVEDDASVRGLVVEVLVELGYRALQAPDGPAGLGMLQGGDRVDLLVTDVGLPGLNGWELAEQARRSRPGLPVLFITGYAEGAIFGEGHLDPGLQLLAKPFSIDALAARIRAMIEAGWGEAPPSRRRPRACPPPPRPSGASPSRGPHTRRRKG